MGFKKKQYAGFGVILAFMLVTAVVMLVSMNHMKKNMSEIVQDRYVKVKMATEIQLLFSQSDRELLAIINDEKASGTETAIQNITDNRAKIESRLNQLDNILNHNQAKDILAKLQNEFASYTETEETIINDARHNKTVPSGVISDYQTKRSHLTGYITDFKNFQENLMSKAMKNASQLEKNLLQMIVVSSGLMIAVMLFIAYWIVSGTAKSLNNISKVMTHINYDDLTSLPRVDVKTEDEIGEIGAAFNRMAASLEQASQKEKNYIEQISERNWMQTTLAEMATMYQNITHINTLAERFIQKAVPVMAASMGAFYLKRGEKTKAEFVKIAAYAEDRGNPGREKFSYGEGLAGQCALEKESRIITDVPENYSLISTGLDEAKPRSILIAPVIYEEEVLAVLELASLEEFTPARLELIKQINHTLGMAINSVLSRMEVERLLKESQMMTEELQAQSEELQSQSEELQAQSEELQSQSEELRMINEQLEERTKEAEKRAQELEKTKHQLEEKAEQLIQSSQYKSEFLANMSHELRTPLNSILLLSEMLADESEEGNLTEEQKEFARVIHSSGSDLLNLINDILDLSKVEAGKMEIVIEETNTRELPVYVGNQFAYLAEQKGLELKIDVDENVPDLIYTDQRRFQQIVKNLLSNAVKFTENGSVTFRMRKVSAETAGKYVKTEDADFWLEVAVQDTGIGIPEKKQDLIFEAFQQGDGATGRKYGGTGLGLSICREFARLLGGTICLDSTVGKGSTFILYIPSLPNGMTATEEVSAPESEVAPALLHEEDQQPGEEASADQALRNKTVLICDDDNRNIYALKKALSKEGMKVLVSQNGFECLDMLDLHKEVDIVLMDIMMPGMDGYETMQRIRKNDAFADLPIIALTAKAMKGDWQKCLGAGATDYISKPLKMDQLLSVMRVWLPLE
ncbi:response regulator [Heyndrickxia coagulans]|uniref:hybrid sensor histidine kinase/response regulator n=1 Tax=Heyndrickxia coagulans TaxID=1398 RepID=UPI001005624B|nr:ATP-binding protein [Heyndrickxia coagulans]QAU27008.1 response regulator [Heyndrickxia coagulans]